MTKGDSVLNGPFPGVIRRAGTWRALLWVWVLCCIVGSSAGPFGSAAAQEIAVPDVHVSVTADPEELTVGDLATLILEVTHPSDHVVVLPSLGSVWGPFEVRSQEPARTDPGGDGISTTRKRFRVALFAPGEYETPSLPLTVRAADGSVSLVNAPAARLTVRSVLSGADDALRDIRSPADLSESFWDRPAVRVLVSLFALGSLGMAAYMLYRRLRGDAATPEPVMDTRTPREIATQELDRIERLDLPGYGQFKEHYTLVSAVLRAYLQATRFVDTVELDTGDMTTEEIVSALRDHSLDSRHFTPVRDLLLEADLVKYSSYAPHAPQAYEALARAREIVVEARPEAVAPPDGSPQYRSEAPV